MIIWAAPLGSALCKDLKCLNFVLKLSNEYSWILSSLALQILEMDSSRFSNSILSLLNYHSFCRPLTNVSIFNILNLWEGEHVIETEMLCFVGLNLFKVMKLMKAENVSFCNEIVTAEDWCWGETRELTMFGGNTTNSFQKSNTA